MVIYYLLFSGLIFMKVYYSNYRYVYKSEIAERKFLRFSSISIMTLMCLRHITVGCDLLNYQRRYELSEQLFRRGFNDTEWAYNFLNYLFKDILHLDYRFLIAFIAIVSILCLAYALHVFAPNTFLCVMVFLTIGNFTMYMSGLRQTLAISLTLLALVAAKHKKPFVYILIMIVAFFVHNSSIVFIPVYFLYKLKLTKNNMMFILILSVATYLIRGYISGIVYLLSPTKYLSYSLDKAYQMNIIVVVVQIVFAIFSIMFMESNEGKYNEEQSLFFLFICLKIIFFNFSYVDASVGRLAYYFDIGLPICASYALKSYGMKQGARSELIFETVIVFLCAAYFLISTPGGTLQIDKYAFFWQSE